MKQMISRTSLLAFWVVISTSRSHAQCPPGHMLVGEDEKYWYCEPYAASTDSAEMVEKAREQLLGSKYRYRKDLIDELGSILGTRAANGGKVDVTVEGGETIIEFRCVAPECASGQMSVDCSGASAYGALAACVTNALCQSAFPQLRGGLGTDAA